MEAAGGRRRRGQRLLYYFRTPPSVRVGRDAIDEEAMRLLEEHNPDISFDWGRLLKSGAAASSASAPPGSARERREDRRDDRRQRSRETPPAAAHVPVESVETAMDPPTVSETVDLDGGPAVDVSPEPDEPVAPRYARLGAEGLRRLRARYAELTSRLDAKPLEEPERTELFGRVERLNPDAWQTDEDVAHALEEYEVVYESFRPLVGRPPRRLRP